MRIELTPTYWVKIYLSGPIEQAKQVLRRECLAEGLCVTVEPTTYIYTGGEETGYVVGLINYPRFPSSPERIRSRAISLASTLLAETYQHSALVMDQNTIEWMSIRQEAA
ncbi:hypothetical protein [Pseudomonas sp. LRF_L74]|uniref:hypothetical protein n=1 Tax=Pseudomonas sp. LRF_L74 TaxID=3369422 RepID=UPI003F5F46CF